MANADLCLNKECDDDVNNARSRSLVTLIVYRMSSLRFLSSVFRKETNVQQSFINHSTGISFSN